MLAAAYAKQKRGFEVARWHRILFKAPYPADCREMPKKIAFLFYHRPWYWKTRCGPPPVAGVTKVTDRRHPFRITGHQIMAANVPADEKPAVRKSHLKYPDVCKAWVEFTLIRRFQGRVRARIYEQYDCTPVAKPVSKANPRTQPQCKTRLYKVSDERYLYLQKAGAKISLNFYFSTPPALCRKPGLGATAYQTGCFCLGIDKTRVKLEAVDDPFLYLDEVRTPVSAVPGAGARPGSGTTQVGIPACDDFYKLYMCFIGALPKRSQGRAQQTIRKALQAWKAAVAADTAAERAAAKRGCQASAKHLKRAVRRVPAARKCLAP